MESNNKDQALLEKDEDKKRKKILSYLKQKYPNFEKRKRKERLERLKKYRPFTK